MPYKYEQTGTDEYDNPTYDYVWYPDEEVSSGGTDTTTDTTTDTATGGGGTDTLVDQSESERFSDSDKATLLKASQETGLGTGLLNAAKELGATAWNGIVKKYTAKDGSIDWASIGKDALTMGATVHAFNQASQPSPKTGYQGGIPTYTALRQRTQEPGASYRPGQGGHQYFTGSIFANAAADQAGNQGLAALQKISDAQKKAVEDQNAARAAAYTAAHPAYTNTDTNSDKFFGRVARTGLTGGNPAADPYSQMFYDTFGRAPTFTELKALKKANDNTEYIAPSDTSTVQKKVDVSRLSTVEGGGGFDTIKGGGGTDTLTGGTGVDTLTGGTGVDTLTGSGGTDAITDMYHKYLGKDPDPEGLAYWKSQFGDTVDDNELAVFLGTAKDLLKNNPDKDFGVSKEKAAALVGNQAANPDQAYIDLYQNVLGKAPDPEGLAYWKSQFGDTIDPNEINTFTNTAKDLLQKNPGNTYGVAQDKLPSLLKANSEEGFVAPSGGVSIPQLTGDTVLPGGLTFDQLNDTPYLLGGAGNSNVVDSGYGMQDQLIPPGSQDANPYLSNKYGKFGMQDDVISMAAGGATSHHGKYLQGSTDGMADKIPGTIDGIQPARLAHGEFVIPADVVSHLGNGNSDAGAQQLYKMMDRIRMARTGNKEQGKRIDPNKFMPGGLAHAAKYAEGGILRFAGTDGSVVPSGTVGTEQGLSNWAGEYATDILGKGRALVNENLTNPQFYQGQLSAGDSALQQQAYANAGNLATPQSIGTAANTAGNVAARMGELSYGPNSATPYMSSYTQNVTDVVNKEAQRNADIASTQRHAGAVSAGAFGGSRQAIGDAEAARNLAILQSSNTAKGLQDAYTAATNASQFGANYGLNTLQGVLGAASTQGSLGATQNAAGLANLQAQLTAGNQQQATQQAGITADQAMFKEQKEDPFNMLKYQQSLLSGMPIQATSYNVNTDPWAAAANAYTGVSAAVK